MADCCRPGHELGLLRRCRDGRRLRRHPQHVRPAQQLAVIQKVHEKFVDDALFLFVAHDVGPRAMSPRVKGFRQAQNWYQDLTPVTMA